METFNQLLEMCVFPNFCLCPFLYPISPLEKIASATLEVVLVWTNSVGAFGHRTEEDIPCGVVRVPCLGRQCDLSLPVALEYRPAKATGFRDPSRPVFSHISFPGQGSLYRKKLMLYIFLLRLLWCTELIYAHTNDESYFNPSNTSTIGFDISLEKPNTTGQTV